MSNTWRPTQQICRELRGFHLAVLRAVFPKPPGKPPEGCHANEHHFRWILTLLAEEKRPLADVMFLQRFHRWAGHIARSPHEPLRQLFSFRDGDWWHKQHLVGVADWLKNLAEEKPVQLGAEPSKDSKK